MTFWKVSDTRMNCLITEAEIAALGYSLEDLTQDRERTEEFLNLLLKKGKEVLGLNTDNGIQGFYGAFLPDRSLMLSISCQAENSQPGRRSTASGSGQEEMHRKIPGFHCLC